MSGKSTAATPVKARGATNCKACTRRRIQCDRTKPSCLKCTNRHLECPGYGSKIRWANAVAVRGRFKGMQYPVDQSQARAMAWSEAVAAIATMIPSPPNLSEIEGLVSYYSSKIAGNMIWVDSPSNPYRRLVIPKAQSSPVILLAILAVAAEHMAATEASPSTFAPEARDVVVSKISNALSRITKSSRDGPVQGVLDLDTVEWVIASMLILSNYECIGDSSTAWCSHRLGARLLINGLTDSGAEASELFRFLRAQFGIHDVLASTTTFLRLGKHDVVVPKQGDPEALLSEYMRLIHQITVYVTSENEVVNSIPSLASLRIKFEEIRGVTLMNAANHPALDDDAFRHNFIQLVDVHHLAALLYAYRCVYNLESHGTEISNTMTQLFERLEYCADNESLIQHLTWPLFIAGTECSTWEAKKHLVLQWYERIMKKTGFRNYKVVTSFLQEIWDIQPKGWLEMAKVWERDDMPLLAV